MVRRREKWFGEEKKRCGEEKKWCGEEKKWCGEKKLYFEATVLPLPSWLVSSIFPAVLVAPLTVQLPLIDKSK